MRKAPLLSLLFSTMSVGLAAACSSDATQPPRAVPDAATTSTSPPSATTTPDAAVPVADAALPIETTFAVAAPLRDFAESRRLLRAVVSDGDGLAKVYYTVNGGAPVDVAVPAQAKRVTVAAALPLVPGPNTVKLVAVDSRGIETANEIPFRFGLVAAAGGSHSGAVVNGKAYVFGRNNVGQLGLGVTDPSIASATPLVTFGNPATPTPPVPASLAFNQNISVLVSDRGAVWTWGENTNGELGLGDSGVDTRRNVPSAIASLADAAIAATGFGHVVVVKKDGSLVSWGKNDVGQVGVPGDGTATDKQVTPIAVASPPADVVKVIAGSAHTAALTASGTVFVWGRNRYGNLGGGTTDEMRHPVPTAVPGLTDVVDIANGRDHIVAVKADGSVVSWGLGASGQLGTGSPNGDDRTAPGPVVTDEAATKPLADITLVFANGNTSFALSRTGALWGFGEDGNGTLAQGGAGGDGAKANKVLFAVRAGVFSTPGGTPEYLDQRLKYRSIAVGALHVIAWTDKNELYSWGWNTQGTLGIADFPAIWRQPTPVVVKLP